MMEAERLLRALEEHHTEAVVPTDSGPHRLPWLADRP
jgi:hypothetical protein